MAYQRRVVQSIQLLRSYTKLTAVLETISMILFSSVLFYELEQVKKKINRQCHLQICSGASVLGQKKINRGSFDEVGNTM